MKTLDLNEGSISATDEALTKVAVSELRMRVFPTRSVLVAMYGGWEQIGRTSILEVPAAVNQAISVLEAHADLDPSYLLLALQHGRRRWRQYAASTRKDPNITKSDVLGFKIPVPPLTEQRRIGELIGAVSAQERAIEASIAKLEVLSAGVMAELAGVECGTFEQVLDYGPQNGIYKPGSSYGLEGTPIVRIDSFRGGPSDLTRNLLRVSLGKGEIDRYGLVTGDILINRVNTPELVGKSTAVGELMESTVFESNMMRCKLRADLAVPAFVETWLGGPTAKAHFRMRAKSAISQASVNSGDVHGCPFPKLDLSGQLDFLERLAAVRDQQRFEKAELAKLSKLKQGVMDDLLGDYGRA